VLWVLGVVVVLGVVGGVCCFVFVLGSYRVVGWCVWVKKIFLFRSQRHEKKSFRASPLGLVQVCVRAILGRARPTPVRKRDCSPKRKSSVFLLTFSGALTMRDLNDG